MSRPAVVPLLLFVAALSSCQGLLPYTASDGAPSPADSAVDGAVDVEPVDTSPGESLTCPPPPPVQATCDTAGQCVECEPVAIGRCSCQCLGRPGDRDCDGIPDSRDPWPARCNRLIHAASFLETNNGWVLGADDCRGCGSISFGTCLRAAELPQAATAGLPVNRLVELRFWPVVGFMDLSLSHEASPSGSRECKVSKRGGGYQARLEIDVGLARELVDAPELLVPSAAGVVLQLWYDGSKSACRISEPAVLAPWLVTAEHGPAAGGSIKLGTGGPALLDYVRVYAVDP